MSRWALLSALALLPVPAVAQDSTAAVLERARQEYERLDIERALPLLRQVLSPQWPHPVTPAQRVEAYVYVGAALVLVGQRDSAVFYFGAALARDAFTDLDPRQFTPAQTAAFAAARRLAFAVALRPVAPARADVRTERITFTVATTHAAALQVFVQPAPSAHETGVPVPIFTGESQGVREVAWDGIVADGRLAPAGRYALLAVGRSRLVDRADSARVFFQVEHSVAALEDTLPSLARGARLPEHETGRARGELLKGAAVAAGALLAAGALANRDLGNGGQPRGGAALVAGVALVVGVAGFVRARPELPDNIAANQRREAERRTANEAIRRQNAERLGGTLLVITPAAGVGP